MKIKNKNVPKVTLILIRNGKRTFLYPSLRKTQNFIRNKAKHYFKNGYLIKIRVRYGYGIDAFGKRVMFENAGTYNSVGDLKWAYQAFVKEYME